MGSALAEAFFFPGPSAHCPGVPPKVEFAYPSPGVSIQTACYSGFDACAVDTFYADKLRDTLKFRYENSKYAVVAFVDSISNFLTVDTTWYRGVPYYVDTIQAEKVWISIASNLKDSLPVSHLVYTDQWLAFPNNPFSTTYFPLVDTPFVAFFTEYESIRQLGIGPMDGCFFEPTAYTLSKNQLQRKGLVGERMPGVSVTWDDFLKTVGHDPVPAPEVRERHIGLAPAQGRRADRIRSRAPFKRFGVAYDLRGRRLFFGGGAP